MKVGLFWDSAININSYYVKNGVAYDYSKNEPYIYHHSMSPECYPATHNLQFLWESGHFLNLSEWVDKDIDFPDLDLDVIFYACERQGLDDENWDDYSVERLKRRYPNTKIIGYIKEVYVREGRENNRINFFKECDGIHGEAYSYHKTLDEYLKLEKLTGHKINWHPQPLNIDYYYDKFYSDEKINGIYAYLPNPIHRRGRTYEFAEYISNKYDLSVYYKPLERGQKFDYISQSDFVKMWSPYLYHFNLDPIKIHPGGQCMQVASVGSINIGGLNEAHHYLYPETATCDEKILEDRIVEYLNNPEKRFQVIQNAWNKLNEIHSFNNIKSILEKFYKN